MTKARARIPDAVMTIEFATDDRVSTAVEIPPDTEFIALGFPAAWDGVAGVNLLVSNDNETTWRVAIDALAACLVGNSDAAEVVIQDSPVVSIEVEDVPTDMGKYVEIAHRIVSSLWHGSSHGDGIPCHIRVAAQDNQTANRDIEVYFAG